MKITLAIPSAGHQCAWPCVTSYMGLRLPAGASLSFKVCPQLPVDEARNALVRDFLQSDSEWLLFADADMVIHPDSLIRLLSWNLPLVSALYFARAQVVLPHVFRGAAPGEPTRYQIQVQETYEWIMAHRELTEAAAVVLEPRPDDALVTCDFTGCGLVLIHRVVLQTIEPPWFRLHDGMRGGEDYYFYRKAIAAGFTPYIDRSVVAGHLPGDRPLSALDFIAWYHISEVKDGSNDGGDQPQSAQARDLDEWERDHTDVD